MSSHGWGSCIEIVEVNILIEEHWMNGWKISGNRKIILSYRLEVHRSCVNRCCSFSNHRWYRSRCISHNDSMLALKSKAFYSHYSEIWVKREKERNIHSIEIFTRLLFFNSFSSSVFVVVLGSVGTGTSARIALYISVRQFIPCIDGMSQLHLWHN